MRRVYLRLNSKLPAQSHHLAVERPALRDVDQVENDLVFAHVARKRFEDFRIAQAYNENVRFGNHGLDGFAHKGSDVRDMLLDEPPVRSKQPRQVHLRVVHEQAQSFADELLCDQHQRALAQIVGPGLERQADHPHAAAPGGKHFGNGMLDMHAVGCEHVPQHRQFYVTCFREIQGRAQVFGQARAAECEPGFEVGGRNIELPVLAYQVHHLEGVDAQRLAQACGFVGECYLQSVEIVAAILDHFGSPYRGDVELAWKMTKQFAQACRRRRGVGADHCKRRPVVVPDRGALAQEFGLEAHVEALAIPFRRLTLDDGAQHVLDRSGHQSRAEHEHMAVPLAVHGPAQIVSEPDNRRLVLAAVRRRGRADTDKRELGIQYRLQHVGRNRYLAARSNPCHEVNHSLLHHRCLAVPDQLELGLVDVDPYYRVAVAGETRQGNGAYVSKTEYADSHYVLRILRLMSKNARSFRARSVLIPAPWSVACRAGWTNPPGARPRSPGCQEGSWTPENRFLR